MRYSILNGTSSIKEISGGNKTFFFFFDEINALTQTWLGNYYPVSVLDKATMRKWLSKLRTSHMSTEGCGHTRELLWTKTSKDS